MTQCPGRKAPLPVLARCALVLVLQGAVVSVCHGDVLNLSWDNDLLTGTDQGYTNGVRLSWLSEPAERDRHCRLCLAGRARNLLAPLPGVGAPGTGHSLSFSVRQLMVTPEDIESVQPRYDDLPYVGYLSVSSTLWSTRARRGHRVWGPSRRGGRGQRRRGGAALGSQGGGQYSAGRLGPPAGH